MYFLTLQINIFGARDPMGKNIGRKAPCPRRINSTLLTSSGSVTEKFTWKEYHSTLKIPEAKTTKLYFHGLLGVANLKVKCPKSCFPNSY